MSLPALVCVSSPGVTDSGMSDLCHVSSLSTIHVALTQESDTIQTYSCEIY